MAGGRGLELGGRESPARGRGGRKASPECDGSAPAPSGAPDGAAPRPGFL